MCGIAGFISKEKSAPNDERAALLDRMCRIITHRGPDLAALKVRERVALGMRRLSIIDLASGQQPIFDCTGRSAIVFNGEIYKYQTLKKDLESRGHRFKTNSDTETIVHLYEDLGVEAFERLEGMFALALWDARTQQLVLARDRAGKKPLFIYRSNRLLAFGSEMKAFFGHPDIAVEPDPGAIPYYFIHGYVPGPATFYSQVEQVPPGTCVVVDADGRTHARKYWQIRFPPAAEVRPIERREAIEGVRDRATLSTWSRVLCEGFGAPLAFGEAFSEMAEAIGLDADSPFRHYLARIGGGPVATCSLFLGAGIAGIYDVSTIPDRRREGIGAAITRHAMDDARAAGYRMAILHASQLGVGMYRSLGFETLCDIGQHVWAPEYAAT